MVKALFNNIKSQPPARSYSDVVFEEEAALLLLIKSPVADSDNPFNAE